MDAFEAASLSQRAMAARPQPYLDDLNPAQREAVELLEGPVLMLAGAGTGKTKALTARIVHLLNTGSARPNEILAVTFTNKAAREMKNRVGGMLGHAIEGMPWLGTFHAICVKLLRRHAELVGLKSNFTILDTDDQLRLMKQLVSAAGIDDKRWPARQLASIIDSWKNRAITPDKVPAADAGAYNHQGPKIYAQYQARLIELNAVDFGDLLLHMVSIFQNHPDVLEQYQRWFRYILVDEYQDTNVAHYMWLRLLAGGHKNICCVGDDDQSIYGWRGAEVGNILRFEKDFPGAHVVRLEQNYRSTEHILRASNQLIHANRNRLGKTLDTELGVSAIASAEGRAVHKVRLIGHWDEEEEARWIGEKIEDLSSGVAEEARTRFNTRFKSFQQMLDHRAKNSLSPIGEQQFIRESLENGEVFKDVKIFNLLKDLLSEDVAASNMLGAMQSYVEEKFSLNEIAVLVRASHQMRALEDRFLTIGLPYRVIGGPRFYERMEIRDAMAYFRVVTSPDDDLAFERIVNTPKRGLGDKAQQTIQTTARSNGVSLLEGARLAVQAGLIKGKGGIELNKLLESIAIWITIQKNTRNSDLIVQFEEEAERLQIVLADRKERLREEEERLSKESKLDDPDENEVKRLQAKVDRLKAEVVEFEVSYEAQRLYIDGLQGDHCALAKGILVGARYKLMWQNDKTPEAPGRLENLNELINQLDNFENLQGFLEHVSLVMDNEREGEGPKVSIMTLHAAKGLEFPVVFLPGWEDGLFPSQRSMDESGVKGLEEERRLAYVGITRAEEVCTISFVGNRRVFGQWQSQMPSRFIDEMPADHVDVLTPPGLYGGGYGAAAPTPSSRLEEAAVQADGYNSPGWRRLQARSGERGMSQPRESRNTVIDMQAVAAFDMGARVFHQKFGYGTVIGIEGDKIEVSFEKAGVKNVVARFLTAPDDIPF